MSKEQSAGTIIGNAVRSVAVDNNLSPQQTLNALEFNYLSLKELLTGKASNNVDRAVREIVVKIGRWYDGSNHKDFTTQLIGLFDSANDERFMRLAKGFPLEAELFREWKETNSHEAFMNKYIKEN